LGKLHDLTGQRFGRVVVLSKQPSTKKATMWLCQCDCGALKTICAHSLTRINGTKSCGCLAREKTISRNKQHRGSSGYNWQGGKHRHRRGYIQVLDPASTEGTAKYILEHTLVMEQYLGRKLFPWERVHHLNGVKDDNRIENFELWASWHPSGQRVTDLVSWAKEVLQTYSPESFNLPLDIKE
jgi:hypothetical protein